MGLFDRKKKDNLAEDGTLDESENKKLGDKIRKSRDYAPSSRIQTDNYKYFQEAQSAMLGAPYDVSKIPIDVLTQMKFDPMIMFAEHFITMPLLRARWHIECVAEGQRVMMRDGTLKNIEFIEPGDEVLSSNGEIVDYDTVIDKWNSGKKDILKITLENGRTMRVSGDHKIWVWDEWIEARDLTVGDPIATPRTALYDETSSANLDDAFLLALWLAEGSKHKPTYEVSNLLEENRARAREIAEKRGWDFTFRDRYKFAITNESKRNDNTPVNFLRKHEVFDLKTKDIFVPNFIKSASKEVIAEFLGEYISCDGCVTQDSVRVISTSITMAKDIQFLFNKLGINSSIQTKEILNENHNTQYVVNSGGKENISKIKSQIYIYGKQNKLLAISDVSKETDKSIPAQYYDEKEFALPAYRAEGFNPRKNNWGSRRTALGVAIVDKNTTLRNKVESLNYSAIKSIESDGADECYDITTLKHHAFFLEGGLTHNCEDAQVAAFVDAALRKVYASYLLERSQSHIYGFKPIVKRFQLENPDWKYLNPSVSDTTIPVWDSKNVEAKIFKHFVGLPSDPEICQPRFNAKGEFNGIEYTPQVAGVSSFPFQKSNSSNEEGYRKIPAHLSLWATNQRHTVDGSLWGFPRIGYAYRYWFSYWLRWAMYDRYFERKSDPPYVVYYPTDPGEGTEDEDGASMKAHALRIGDAAKSGGTIALPGDFVTDYEGRVTGNREWEVKELEIAGDLTHFVESFEYLDKMKVTSLLVPDKAIRGGDDSSDAEHTFNIFKQSEASEMEQIDDEINRFIIPDLIAANFPDRNVTARKVTTGFDDADLDTMMEIIRVVGQTDQNALKAVDFDSMLDTIGIPSISHDEIVRREQAVKDEIESFKPDPIVPIPGEQAGVDEEGFYIQPREKIILSEDSSFISKLPPTRHYNDEEVLQSAREIRAKWNVAYKDIYDDVATFLSSVELSEELKGIDLADDDQASKLAFKIISKWNFSKNKTKKLIEDTKTSVRNIIARAGSRELRRIRTEDDWKVDSESVATYLEDRGLEYVKAIEDTIRDEVASYLAQQIRDGKSNTEIADGVREHFSDSFPDWKATRLVRSEVRNAYNFATLEAGQQAGIKVVQAKDAQLPQETDQDCIDRNGNFYSIPQALTENLKEHPNGTLEWKLIPDVSSVSEVTVEASEIEDGGIGYFDNITNTIYLNEDATKEEAEQFRILLGEILSNDS